MMAILRLMAFLLMSIVVAERRDSYQLRMMLTADKSVKIPQVIKKMYKQWTSKPEYEPKMIQSIPVQVTHMEERTLLMTAPFPRAKNSSVQNVELWMEFENEERLIRSQDTTYVAHIKPTSDNCVHSIRSAKKPHAFDNQIKLRFNITSLYLNCKDEDVKYLQLTIRLESEDSDMDLSKSKMDVFIILQEMVEKGAIDLVNVNPQEIARKAFEKLRQKIAVDRIRRAAGDKRQKTTTRKSRFCRLRKWYVKFVDIGWDWVIAPPTGFNANRCQGKCSFPLSAFTNTTNHAVVQTLANSIFGKPKSACCVAKELSPLTMLFLEDNGIIIMKMYPDMVAKSCACL